MSQRSFVPPDRGELVCRPPVKQAQYLRECVLDADWDAIGTLFTTLEVSFPAAPPFERVRGSPFFNLLLPTRAFADRRERRRQRDRLAQLPRLAPQVPRAPLAAPSPLGTSPETLSRATFPRTARRPAAPFPNLSTQPPAAGTPPRPRVAPERRRPCKGAPRAPAAVREGRVRRLLLRPDAPEPPRPPGLPRLARNPPSPGGEQQQQRGPAPCVPRLPAASH